jgi:hypothetical protein
MRPVLFSSTTAAPCTVGRIRISTRAPSVIWPLRVCLTRPSITLTKMTSLIASIRRALALWVESGSTRPSRSPTRIDS